MARFHQKLLQDAVKLMGRDYVAKALEVPTLDQWLRGEGTLSGSHITKLTRAAVDFAQKNR